MPTSVNGLKNKKSLEPTNEPISKPTSELVSTIMNYSASALH
jgi:hypothetical protein